MKKHKITEQDYLKANRKASREEEIALYGRLTQRPAVHQSKKTYNRKRAKAGIKNLPFLRPIHTVTRSQKYYLYLQQ